MMDIDEDMREEKDEHETLQDIADRLGAINVEKVYDVVSAVLSTTEKEEEKFSSLSEDAQDLCVKAIFRLCFFKGTKNEPLTRTQMNDVLGRLEGDYKRHLNAILSRVQKQLLECTGYFLVNGEAIIGYKYGKRDEFYLINSLSERSQRAVRAELMTDKEAAFAGLRFVLFHILANSPGGKAAINDLLRDLRGLDSRFPQTIGRTTGRGSASSAAASSLPPIPQLGDTLQELLARLRREQYVLFSRSDEGDGEPTECLELGARFYLELGRKTLLLSYYHLLGQPVDEVALRMLDEEQPEEESEGQQGQQANKR
jgi:hypothetical protein